MSVSVRRDVVFSHARIGYEEGRGPMQILPLKLDCYLPDNPARTPTPGPGARPDGGALHRGSKEAHAFNRVGNQDGQSRTIAAVSQNWASQAFRAVQARGYRPRAEPQPGAHVARRGADVSCECCAR